MRTRPDAQQEALTRRLALIRPDQPAERSPDTTGDDWWAGHTMVPGWSAPAPGLEADAAESPTPGVPVPEPGRHAARRSRWLLPPLPDALRGRASLGTAQLAIVALALAAALAVTCWWLARGRATTLAPVSSPVAPSASAAPLVALAAPVGVTGAAAVAPSAAATGSAGAMVTVDVEGKVRRPGVVILPVGSRVSDALRAAGGVPHRPALGGLNLAAVLTDGQQIMVGGAPATPVNTGITASGTSTAAGADAGPLVNLNTATAEELDTLPDVGPVTAQSILEWREQNGGFTSVQELLEVDGIGPATLEKLTPHVTV